MGEESPRLARLGSERSRLLVRVTTANGCFMAPRPTERRPACLRYVDLVAGTQGSMRS